MRGRGSARQAFGLAILGGTVALAASCAGKSEGIAGDEGIGGGASGVASDTGGSGARAGSSGAGGSGAGRGGASRGGATSTGGVAGVGGDPSGGIGGLGEGGESGGAGVGGAAGNRPVPGVCNSPTAWSDDLERCTQGFVHRPVARACPLPVRDELIQGLAGNAGVEMGSCSADRVTFVNDCTRDVDCGNNAFCLRTIQCDDYNGRIEHRCRESCAADDDCGLGFVCVCDRVIQNATRREIVLGSCKPATCRTDADCGAESFCFSPLNFPDRSGRNADPVLESSFHCQTPEHECFGRSDCPSPPEDDCDLYSACVADGERFVCDIRSTSLGC